MVRVGGGWAALDEFLVKNDPVRGESWVGKDTKVFCTWWWVGRRGLASTLAQQPGISEQQRGEPASRSTKGSCAGLLVCRPLRSSP